MPSIKLEIMPFEVPEQVEVRLPDGDTVDVQLKDLDEEALAELIEGFTNAVLEKAGKTQ